MAQQKGMKRAAKVAERQLKIRQRKTKANLRKLERAQELAEKDSSAK